MILMAVTILMVVFGELPLIAFIGVISLIGLIEFYRALGFHRSLISYVCLALGAVYEAMIFTSAMSLLPVYCIVSLTVILALYVFCYPEYDTKTVMGAFFGLFYIVFMLSFIFMIRVMKPAGQYLVWLVFISAWGSDTLAYCTGMLFGKHKLTPNLSPKKSVEGAIGGILGAVILSAVYAIIFKNELGSAFSNPILCVVLITLICSAVSIVGDLAASAIKRGIGIKDFGNIIPGHGGVLDRFDSITITAPCVFLLIMLFSVAGI